MLFRIANADFRKSAGQQRICLTNVTEKNEEVTFKEKTGKKCKNKNPEVWKDLKLQFEIPLQIPGKTDKVNSKFLQRKKVNSMAEEKKKSTSFQGGKLIKQKKI